jgi:hypothetical protein
LRSNSSQRPTCKVVSFDQVEIELETSFLENFLAVFVDEGKDLEKTPADKESEVLNADGLQS